MAQTVLASDSRRRTRFLDRFLPLDPWLDTQAARDMEQGQARTRLMCTVTGLLGFMVIGLFATLPDGIIATAVLFSLYSVGCAMHVYFHPEPTYGRRGLALVVDNVTASYIASFGGLFAPYVAFHFLCTNGWGLRFGRRYLFAATAIAVLGMLWNLAATAYWQDHAAFAISLIVGLIANMINTAVLLKRIEYANARLAEKMNEISRLAWQDALTRLPNRLYFQDRLKQTLASAARHQRGIALILFDVDGFKAVNDTLGHQAGDRLLREIALRVGRRIRQADTFARLGGDEFVILMDHARANDEAVLLAQTVLRTVAGIDILPDRRLVVSASVGIAFCPPGPEPVDPDEIIRRADAAMYAAKHAGKGCYRLAEC